MKYLSLILLLCLGCSPVVQPPAVVSYVESTTGTVTVSTEGYGDDLREIKASSACNAISRLTFEGIAGSAYSRALVTTSDRKAESFIDGLAEGDWSRYVISISQESEAVRFKGRIKVATYIVSIDVQALRRALEENGIIRKFGF